MTDARAALVEQVAREMCQLRYPVSHADHPDFWSQLAPRGKNRWLRQAEYVLARERAAMERTREMAAVEAIKWLGGDDGLASNIREMDLPLPDATGLGDG